MADEQQYCLRWNNFQANITSQFEALRDDEDFTDVTIACDGQRLQAHKVVLSACSPFFKELFKSNPCSHPIIFMRDVEAMHIVSLMEFMYAGEVNVAQAHLSAFLKTAESLKIRGLTDTASVCDLKESEEDILNPQLSTSKVNTDILSNKTQQISSTSSTVTSSQDFPVNNVTSDTQPPTKRQCKDQENKKFRDDLLNINPFAIQQNERLENFDDVDDNRNAIQPKLEIPDYLSDDDKEETLRNYLRNGEVTELTGGMEIIPQNTSLKFKDVNAEATPCTDLRKLRSLEPRPCEECGRVYSNLSNLRQHMKLIHYPTYTACTYCSKSFKTDLYLRRHILSCHDNNKSMINSAYGNNNTNIYTQSDRHKSNNNTSLLRLN